jgi:hypothetical protein
MCESVCELEMLSAPPSPESPSSPTVDRSSDRDGRGRFVSGNSAALRHGARSERVAEGLLPEQAEARAAIAERVAAIVASLGGESALSPLALEMVERHVRLGLVESYLFENLRRLGPLTGKGRTRAALNAWYQVVDRQQKSAMALGLERRQKPVDPIDAVRAAVAEANR